MSDGNTPATSEPSKKMVAALLGIFLGTFGAHRFYLGDTKGGLIRLILGVCTLGAGGIIGLIEGIMYLMKTDEDFVKTYQIEKKAWF
jgi:TM2 domain-containing membrane protein YozV